MPGRMREVLRQFPLAQHTSLSLIDLGRRYTRPNRSNGGLLRFQYRPIQLPSRPGMLPHVHGARAIGAITREYNTKIADHEPAPRYARRRRSAMHDRRALASGKDRRK